MRRDMDLMRELMLRLESFPMRRGGIVAIQIPNELSPDDPFAVPEFSAAEIEYHLKQIEMQGFVDDGGTRPANGIGFRCLTPAGHDFIDSIREPKVWKETKSWADKAGGWTLKTIRDIGVAVIRGEIAKHGLPIG